MFWRWQVRQAEAEGVGCDPQTDLLQIILRQTTKKQTIAEPRRRQGKNAHTCVRAPFADASSSDTMLL